MAEATMTRVSEDTKTDIADLQAFAAQMEEEQAADLISAKTATDSVERVKIEVAVQGKEAEAEEADALTDQGIGGELFERTPPDLPQSCAVRGCCAAPMDASRYFLERWCAPMYCVSHQVTCCGVHRGAKRARGGE
jgi:hypothetical protein